MLHCYYVLVFTDLSKVSCISEGKFLGIFTRGIRMGNCPPWWAIRWEIAGKLYPILRAIRPKTKFLIEIPDFGGNSLRNYPEPEGIFGNFPRAEGPREISKNSRGRGVISANSRQNQQFLINFVFYTSSALSKRTSLLCWPAVVSIFCTFVSIQGYQCQPGSLFKIPYLISIV